MDKRILVDMSLTVLHHGHIRLLKKASELGYVIVGLCSDEEIFKAKGFKPLLSYEQRKEIALSIKYVREVIESEYLIDEAYLDEHNIDLLVHGHDNVNVIPEDRLVIFRRTEGISSTQLRNSSQT
jgi:cytidyltransferase-like protein|tara:strand:+ start:420 stop:794 length:375 start_codon:yes stop_codon:yes gene_type:complete